MISAACHHVIFLAIARKMTSWIFTVRSQALSEYPRILPPGDRMPDPRRAFGGHITC